MVEKRDWLHRLILIMSAMILITIVGLFAAKNLAISAIYSTFCGTIVSLCAIYIGGHSAQTWIGTKKAKDDTQSQS